MEELTWPEQWDRHRELHPDHTATFRVHGDGQDGIYCNDCFWHTYERAMTPRRPGWKMRFSFRES